MTSIVMLGPQSPAPNLRAAIDMLDVEGPAAAITAGWRDAEADIAELQQIAGRPVANLSLYQRADAVAQADPELDSALHDRQARLKDQQRLYRIRLRAYMEAARKLLRMDRNDTAIATERRAAVAQIRALDRHHLQNIRRIHHDFDAAWTPLERESVAQHHAEIRAILAKCKLLLIPGGHVAVLLNRIRLFGVQDLVKDMPIIGWSAGAMVLSERIVLYHDHAPQGRRDAEIFDHGLSLSPSIVPLASSQRRLNRDDKQNLILFSRRFAPCRCATLNNGSVLHWKNGELADAQDVSKIQNTGRMKLVRAV